MRSRILTCITAITLFTALAIPARLAAQGQQQQQELKKEHHRYILKDLGTFGGPNSYTNGPLDPTLNNSGIFAGEAETDIPDPYAPNCQDPPCLVQHALEWRNGVVIDMGTLPGVNLSSGASWVSSNGTIVGTSENGLIDPLTGMPENRAVLWRKDGQIVDLGTLEGGNSSFAAAVNNRRQVTGWSLNAVPDTFSFVGGTTQTRAFIWQQGAMQDLGTLGGPDALSQGINERGQIVGISYTNSTPNPTTGIPTIDPFLWENGAMVDLGTLGGTVGVSDFVNSRGQVVGWSDLAGDQTQHPFLWDRGSLRDLGTFGGSNGQAIWINDGGDVVGQADLPDSTHHGFLWKRGVMTDLGTVGTDPCSNGFSINSHEQIVGNSTDCHGAALHGYLWENGGPALDLNSLVIPGSDIRALFPYDINDRGEIAAQGVLPNGDDHAVLLIPCDGNHADIEGCEDGREGATGMTQNNPAPVTKFPAAAEGSREPVGALQQLRARLARRYHILGPGTDPTN
jgi:probable HAF family extracellular repeat protein